MGLFAFQQKELERTRDLLGRFVDSPKGDDDFVEEAERAPFIFRPFHRKFTYAGLTAAQRRATLTRVSLLGGGCFVLALSLGKPIIAFAAFGVFAFELFRLNRKVFKRAESFERDYTALLLSLASGVRTGLDPMVALCECVHLFSEDSEVRRELKKLNSNLERGVTEKEVLLRFGDTIDHPDVALFRTAFILARREGSSLASCLQRLAKVTRHRQSFRRKVKSSIAMQRLSVFGIAICTIVIGIMQFVSNFSAIQKAIAHPVGSKALLLGASLLVLGIVWMSQLSKTKI